MASPVRRLPGQPEARPLRERASSEFERRARDVPLRLEEEEPPARPKRVVELARGGGSVGSLVEDVDDNAASTPPFHAAIPRSSAAQTAASTRSRRPALSARLFRPATIVGWSRRRRPGPRERRAARAAA